VRLVGHLPELYEDARSEKYNIRYNQRTFSDIVLEYRK